MNHNKIIHLTCKDKNNIDNKVWINCLNEYKRIYKDYKIKISNRKLSIGLLNFLKINRDEQKSTTLRAIDKLDRVGMNGVKLLLGKGRKDKSGDFTKGALLNEKQISKIIDFLRIKNLEELNNFECDDKEFQSGLNELKEVIENFKLMNFKNFKFIKLKFFELSIFFRERILT